jgi:hypothetical protein
VSKRGFFHPPTHGLITLPEMSLLSLASLSLSSLPLLWLSWWWLLVYWIHVGSMMVCWTIDKAKREKMGVSMETGRVATKGDWQLGKPLDEKSKDNNATSLWTDHT